MTEEMPIPILDLQPEIEELWVDLQAALEGVLRSGQFILGPNVRAFEKAFAGFLGVPEGVGVNSGTDALIIGLRALDVGEGDEVITTPFTFFATAEAISILGATPVFVDIDPDTFNIDPDALEAAITPRTRCILPVHLFGLPAAMDRIMQLAQEHDLVILEDCAQALGAEISGKKVGTFGDAAAFSFFPSKNLGAFGDAGAIATSDPTVAQRSRTLRAHGAEKKYHNEMLGYNSRLDEIQAAILRVKLPQLSRMNAGRRRAAAKYSERLHGVEGVVCPAVGEDVTHAFHQYTIRVLGGRRDQVAAALQRNGIATMVYYPVPVHKLPVYADVTGPLPVAERAADEVLSLPLWPSIDDTTIDRVVAAVADALG